VKLVEIARIVNGSIYGKGNFEIVNILPPEDAKRSDLTFLFDSTFKTQAGAIIAKRKYKGKSGVVVKDPKEAMYNLLRKIANSKRKGEISKKALIGKNIVLPKSCIVEPYAIIKDNVKIGRGSYVGAYCYIDKGVIIGKNCEIYPNTTIYQNTKISDFVVVDSNTVIGKEGFGFLKLKRYERIKHIGGVIIDDFVEIGANCAIDRGTIGNTMIGKGTKLDNLVHIAHNVKIGKNCIIMGQVGIAGSVRVGNNVTLCGQVGISDHLEIGDNVIVYAKSAVFKSISKNKKYSGIPAREHSAVLKAIARFYKNAD